MRSMRRDSFLAAGHSALDTAYSSSYSYFSYNPNAYPKIAIISKFFYVWV